MEDQIAIKPQEMPVPPPEWSVPLTGREFPQPREIEATYVSPVPPDSQSVAHGEALFMIYCTPCHGPTGQGMGMVVQKGFMPPPALTGSVTRARSDGYIYSYLRHGGIIMPTYGFALHPRDAWDVVNYLRRLQRENPTP